MKIVEKDVRELAAGDLIVAVSEVVNRLSGSPVEVTADRYFVLVEEPGKEEGDE